MGMLGVLTFFPTILTIGSGALISFIDILAGTDFFALQLIFGFDLKVDIDVDVAATIFLFVFSKHSILN